MSALIPFQFEGKNEVRVVMADGAPWFVGKDICIALDICDVSQAIGRLDDDEKGTYKIPTLGGTQNMLCVNEFGLYSLILTSRKPEAKKFKKWITNDVIPSIRKTGSYEVAKTRPAVSALEYARLIQQHLPDLGEAAMQQMFSEASEIDLGRRLIPLPKIEEEFFTATDLAQEFGITPQKIGKVANAGGLKTAEFGEYRLSKSKHSSKQVEQFYYNKKGRQALALMLAETGKAN